MLIAYLKAGPLEIQTIFFFGAGLSLVIIGYFFMANGSVSSFQSLTLAPIMLFLGYIVVLPIALVYRDKKKIR